MHPVAASVPPRTPQASPLPLPRLLALPVTILRPRALSSVIRPVPLRCEAPAVATWPSAVVFVLASSVGRLESAC